jgi:hypothetical protein
LQNNTLHAWQELYKLIPDIARQNTITRYFSLYEVEPQIYRAYRAGVSVAIKPGNLPSGLVYEDFRGDKYFLWPNSSQKSCSQAR